MKISADKAIHDTFFEKGVKKTAQKMIQMGMEIGIFSEAIGLI